MSEPETPGPQAPAAPPPLPDVKSARLLTTLGAGGAVAGILLVVAFGITLPWIEANQARELDLAIGEVLKAPARYETLFVVNGALSREAPAGTDPKKLERVYVGYGTGDRRVGLALVAGEPGFQDVVKIIFGYDPEKKQLIGMKVLESKETPGLGDKIEKDERFVAQFGGTQVPLVGVKQGKRTKPNEIDMITGATISSRAVIRIINNKLKALGPAVDGYPGEGKR